MDARGQIIIAIVIQMLQLSFYSFHMSLLQKENGNQ